MGPIVHLDLGLCVIRPWREQDVASLARHANNRRVWQNLRDDFPHPYTETHAARFLARAVTADPAANFAIVVGCKAVGGIATAAVRAMTAFAFRAHGKLRRIYAAPFAWNAASARVLEKAGFTLERLLRRSTIKQGRAANQLLYAIVREDGRTRHVSDR